MIAELFYPKELKEIIADLRAKDELDEYVLGRLNDFFHLTLVNSLFLSSIPLVVLFIPDQGKVVLFVCVLTSIFIFISYHYKIRKLVSDYAQRYCRGNKTTAKVTKYFKSSGAGGAIWRLDYKYKIGEREYSTSKTEIPNYFFHKRYYEGDIIDIYYDPFDQSQSVPVVPKLIKILKLRKD